MGHAVTGYTRTHHIGLTVGHLHIAALQVIDPEIVAVHTPDHPIYLKGMNHEGQVHTPAG